QRHDSARGVPAYRDHDAEAGAAAMSITIGSRLSALGSRRALPNVGVVPRVAPFTACELHNDFIDRPKAGSHEPEALTSFQGLTGFEPCPSTKPTSALSAAASPRRCWRRNYPS